MENLVKNEIFKVLTMEVNIKLVTSWAGPNLTPGLYGAKFDTRTIWGQI